MELTPAFVLPDLLLGYIIEILGISIIQIPKDSQELRELHSTEISMIAEQDRKKDNLLM